MEASQLWLKSGGRTHIKNFFLILLLLFYCFMCVGIPTHVKYNAVFLIFPILQNWVCASWMTNIYIRWDIWVIFVKFKYKYRKYHPVFGKTHACLVFHTHVWFLPNIWKSLRCLVKTTHVWFLPNTWTCLMYLVKTTCVVFTKYLRPVHVFGKIHTCVVFTKHLDRSRLCLDATEADIKQM